MARKGGPGDLAALADRLGHRFAEPGRLERALTHGSAASGARADYQRLEFLGDRVLGLLVAEALMQSHPDEAEGGLAPRFNALVRRETLAEIAGEIGLGQHLRLGRSEATSGGRRKAAILADALEAAIAAIYLDGGLEAARAVVARHWRARIASQDEAPRDAKTAVQEWAQARGLAPPAYRLVAREGPDHAPRFRVEARLAPGDAAEGIAAATGEAASKKQAEQRAAAALLETLASSVGAER